MIALSPLYLRVFALNGNPHFDFLLHPFYFLLIVSLCLAGMSLRCLIGAWYNAAQSKNFNHKGNKQWKHQPLRPKLAWRKCSRAA